jgi:hypothetical protein
MSVMTRSGCSLRGGHAADSVLGEQNLVAAILQDVDDTRAHHDVGVYDQDLLHGALRSRTLGMLALDAGPS